MQLKRNDQSFHSAGPIPEAVVVGFATPLNIIPTAEDVIRALGVVSGQNTGNALHWLLVARVDRSTSALDALHLVVVLEALHLPTKGKCTNTNGNCTNGIY